MVKQKYQVTGMTCSACSAHVEKAVRGVSGVSDVSVNLLTNSMVVDSECPLAPQTIIDAVEHAGYGASPVDAQPAAPSQVAGAATRVDPMQEQLKNMRRRYTELICMRSVLVCAQRDRHTARNLLFRNADSSG